MGDYFNYLPCDFCNCIYLSDCIVCRKCKVAVCEKCIGVSKIYEKVCRKCQKKYLKLILG